MKRLELINSVIAALLSISLLTGCASQPAIPMADANTQEKYNAEQISAYFQSLSDEHSPGFSYLVAKDGKVIAQGAVGLADVENKVPNDTDTKFRAASITKQFTAVSILQLAEQGKLSLDDRLMKYFPDFSQGEKITIRHLLNHTSGIWDHQKDEEFPFPLDQAVAPDVHLGYIKKHDLFFEPGEKWAYSGNGYFMLGLIVEKVSNMPLAIYMQKNLFDPLGMKNSGLYDNHTNYPHSAIGYIMKDGKPVRAINVNMTTWNGAAALYTTVNDLFIWNEALHNGKLLNKAHYTEATTPHKFTNGFVPFVGYGYGLGIEDISGKPTIGHPGQIYGFHSDILRLPEDQISYIFLSNVANGQLKKEGRVAGKVIEMLYQ
ncbi:serine hydrolase [Cellvibrio sp. pealriver]|uniref:serine hydrolase domain-containing protein n=1 Tax=Cellvibrio sp. pealriver TaxID=1622269 RepID=UPI00066FEF81|nr:serine hydrolase domain-containing protein [Cellvibrio sp. pealriver]